MRLTQQELADRLGVSPAAVSQATRRGHNCGGHPVEEWAVMRRGQVAFYEVPEGTCSLLGEDRPAARSEEAGSENREENRSENIAVEDVVRRIQFPQKKDGKREDMTAARPEGGSIPEPGKWRRK